MARDYNKQQPSRLARRKKQWEETTLRRALDKKAQRKETFLSSGWVPLWRA